MWALSDSGKKLLSIAAALFFLLSAVGLSVLMVSDNTPSNDAVCYKPYPDLMAGKASYLTGGKPTKCTLILEKADNPEKRAKGLSGRKNLPANIGMLFIFDRPGKQCMWMKDMNFNIDMVWLDRDKQIIHIEEGVSPSTFPKSFCGADLAQYVIEVKAGVAEATNFRVGERIDL